MTSEKPYTLAPANTWAGTGYMSECKNTKTDSYLDKILQLELVVDTDGLAQNPC